MVDMTIDQAMQNPFLKSLLAPYLQPAAQLQETQAAAGAAGASAAETEQQREINARQLTQQQFQQDTQTLFDSKKGNSPYVDPNTYNTQKAKAASLGIDGDAFDKLYEANYVDPSQQWKYNTSTGRDFLNKRNQITSSIGSQVNDLVNSFGKGFAGGGNNILSGFAVSKTPQGGWFQQTETGLSDIIPGLANMLGITSGAETQYEQGRQAFNQTLQELSQTAKTPGLGLNPSEVEQISKNIPAAGDNYGTIKNKLTALNDQMVQLTGKGLDPAVLQKYGVGEKQMTGGELLKGLVSNAGKNIQEMGQGVAQEAEALATGKMGTTPQEMIGNVALQSLLGLGKTIEGVGSDILQRGPIAGAADYAYKNPVTTASLVAPFLLKGAGAGEAGAEEAGAGGATPSAPTTPVSPQLSAINRITDFLRGGGTKENVITAARYGNNVTENQVMNELGVYTHPTETGQLQAMEQGRMSYGQSLGNIYKNSQQTISADNLTQTLTQKLQDNGVPAQAAQKIISTITKDVKSQGFFDLASQDTKIGMDQLWNAAKWLEKYKPNIKGDPQATAYLKNNADFISSVMRQQLASKVPESGPYAARYGIIKNALDNAKDPSGLNIRQGILRSLLSAGVNISDTLPARLYQLLGGRPLPTVSAAETAPITQSALENPTPFQTSAPQAGQSAALGQAVKLMRDMRTKQGNPQFKNQ